jgi:radical SAM protein with 4Fe4S-binding SPASM domain
MFNRKRSLYWAIFEVTGLCNFNCIWCYANSGLKGQHITKENAERVIQALANAGVIQITFSGGEPLLYPYLKEVIKTAKDYGMITHINTNGYFLTKKLAKELYDIGLTQVQINIDSLDPRKHDKIRGKKGSFDRAVQALKNAKSVGLTCVSQTVLTSQNENEIIDIFNLARSIGVQRCRVWDMMPTGHAKRKMGLRPTDYINTLKKLAEFAYKTGAKNIESGDPLFPLDYKTKLGITGGFCAALEGLFITISSKGDVYLCCAKRDKLYNIFSIIDNKESIVDFHNFKINQYKSQLKLFFGCKLCNHFNRHRGGCPARTGFTKSSIDYWCPYLKNHYMNL